MQLRTTLTLRGSLVLKGNTDEELAEAYAKKVIELAHECGVKLSLKDNGVTREEFDKAVDDLAHA